MRGKKTKSGLIFYAGGGTKDRKETIDRLHKEGGDDHLLETIGKERRIFKKKKKGAYQRGKDKRQTNVYPRGKKTGHFQQQQKTQEQSRANFLTGGGSLRNRKKTKGPDRLRKRKKAK